MTVTNQPNSIYNTLPAMSSSSARKTPPPIRAPANGRRSPGMAYNKSPSRDSLKTTVKKLHDVDLHADKEGAYLDRFDQLSISAGANSSPKVISRRGKSPKKVTHVDSNQEFQSVPSASTQLSLESQRAAWELHEAQREEQGGVIAEKIIEMLHDPDLSASSRRSSPRNGIVFFE